MEKFIMSVARINYPNLEFWVVDGGSTDGSLEYLRKNFPSFNIIQQRGRRGTADAMNVGAQAATGKYVFWLANDMEVTPDAVRLLVDALESDSCVGACGCTTVKMRADGSKLNEIDHMGFKMDVFGFPDYQYHKLERSVLERFKEPVEVFFCGGDQLMIRKDLLGIIGGYDPQYFSLNEDADLCWRIWLSGRRVLVHPRAVVYHVLSGTLGRVKRSRLRYHSEKNMFSNILKNYEPATLMRIVPEYLGLLFAEIIFLCMSGRGDLALADISAIIWVLKNCRPIWRIHQDVTRFRKVSDAIVQRLMVRHSLRIEHFRRQIVYGDVI